MAWWMVAAAAAPYVMAALQDKPNRPGAPAPAQLTNRDGHANDMLDMAFNPNNETWMLASEQTADHVNRLLGRTGMAGSSVGAQIQMGTQAKLAQAWLENQASRQANAFNAVVNYDKAKAGIASDNANAQYNYAMDAYKDHLQRNANQVQGVSNLINAGVGYYNQDRFMDQRDQMIAGSQKPSYGVPGPSSGWQPGPPPQDYQVPAGIQYYDQMYPYAPRTA